MKRLIVNFSGGRTSAYMTWRILQEWRDRYDDIVVIFANTGLEHEKTLNFVKDCDENFGFNTVWLESVTTQEKGVGQGHKVVNFSSASRNGEPYYDYVKKHGIPNVATPKCTSRLKVDPIRSFIRDVLGHKKRDYQQCIGIRVDEIDRMQDPDTVAGKGLIYPLVRWGITKEMVLQWWANQDFDLDLPEHMGNCVTCFKKSDRKLLTIAKHNPEFFEPMARMERDLSMAGPRAKNAGEPMRFFRKHRTTQDIIASSKKPFVEWCPALDEQFQMGMFDLGDMDISNGCTESCEVDYV